MNIMTPPAPIRWQPKPALAAPAPGSPVWVRPGVVTAMTRGLIGRCPCCGRGALFAGWLRQAAHCTHCRAPLAAARADDAPPYVVIFVVAHLVIGTQVMADTWLNLSVIAEAAIFLPLTLALCLGLLRPVKGATIGLIIQLGIVGDTAVQP
jgi:uncharacterized protein (DUF983 family)